MKAILLLKKYANNLSQNRADILIKHSKKVANLALKIAKKNMTLKPDLEFIKEAALLHDIGTTVLIKDVPYILHGILGREILEKEGFKKYSKVCEKHIGCGISKKEASEFIKKSINLPERDMIPETLEEKIICLADKFYSKSYHKKEKIEDIEIEIRSYGEGPYLRFLELKKLL